MGPKLGRHSTRNSSKVCVLFFFCVCESVEHVLKERSVQ